MNYGKYEEIMGGRLWSFGFPPCTQAHPDRVLGCLISPSLYTPTYTPASPTWTSWRFKIETAGCHLGPPLV